MRQAETLKGEVLALSLPGRIAWQNSEELPFAAKQRENGAPIESE